MSIDTHRGAAFLDMCMSRNWSPETAGRAVLALHPLDDGYAPPKTLEAEIRLASAEAAVSLGGATSEADAYRPSTSALRAYLKTAIAHDDAHYIQRYGTALGNEESQQSPALEIGPAEELSRSHVSPPVTEDSLVPPTPWPKEGMPYADGEAWYADLRAQSFGHLQPIDRWVAEATSIYLYIGEAVLADNINASRFKKTRSWRSQVRAIMYSQVLPGLASSTTRRHS